MLTRDWIAARIPHQGKMCLLDAVVEFSSERIHCRSITHRQIDHPENPLRAAGRLGAACGIEYAVQAMAVHGALLSADGGNGEQCRPRKGFLASVRSVELFVAHLDDIDEALDIIAERLSSDDNNILYSFRVEADGRHLLSGRAAVILDAEK